jgi:capsule polysaccharide export protein KpsE/RkpR
VRLDERLNLAALARLAFLNRDPHLANMIDSKRFTKDSADVQAAMAANGHARRRTGATAVIEPILPLIRELRARKHSWAAIAAALAKQGVVQGVNREPISARRLTALISAINKRLRRQGERLAGRAKRRDLAPLPASSHTLALSTDLRRTNATAAVTATDSEASIRHQEFEDRVRSLLKQDPS